MSKCLLPILVALWGLLCTPLHAQSVGPFPITTYRNATTIGPGEIDLKTWDVRKIQPYADGLLNTGPIEANMPQPNGSAPHKVTVRAPLPAANVNAAIRRFAAKTLPVIPVIGNAYGLYILAQELGVLLNKELGGDLTISQTIPGVICSGGTCHEFSDLGRSNRPYFPTPQLAANDAIGAYKWAHNGTNYPVVSTIVRPHPSSSGNWQYLRRYGITAIDQQQDWNNLGRRTVPESPTSTTRNLTIPEFLDLIDSNPTPTSPGTTVSLKDSLDSGESIVTGTPTVTGHATTPGTSTVTINNDNTTTTTTTENNHTYQGDTVNTTVNTTTVVTDNVTNNVISTVTTVQTPVIPQKAPEQKPFEMPCGTSGKAPCAVKVDESGTPPIPPRPFQTGEDSIDAEKTKIETAIEQNKTTTIPAWTWSFQFPTGCTTIPMFLGVVVDVCKYQPIIHDLMSMIWLATGVFGLFSIFRMGVH